MNRPGLFLLMAFFVAASAAAQTLAVRGETVYTMEGAPIIDGVVLVRDGRIERVGAAASIAIPPGMPTMTARVVTPGLIDAHTVVGISGFLNQKHDQEQIERSAPLQPELRAIDAYNPRERLIDWVRSFGVTTMHTGHGPGALMTGQTMIVKTRGETVDEAVLVPEAMIAASLGELALAERGKSPGTRAKSVAMFRAEFLKAQEYARKRVKGGDAKPERDLHLETLGRVLRREMPLLLTVHRAHDIVSALRLAKEFNVRLVLDGASESYLVIDEIREAKVPVILHATMQRAVADTENVSFETASILKKAGIPVALQSGYERYVPKTRVVLFEAAIAAANGLGPEGALATITIDAARILGLERQVGSIVPGKDADLVLFDGDPFEYTTHVVGVVLDGKVVSRGEQGGDPRTAPVAAE